MDKPRILDYTVTLRMPDGTVVTKERHPNSKIGGGTCGSAHVGLGDGHWLDIDVHYTEPYIPPTSSDEVTYQ